MRHGDIVLIRARVIPCADNSDLYADFGATNLPLKELVVASVEHQEIRCGDLVERQSIGATQDLTGEVISTIDYNAKRILWVHIKTSGPSFGSFSTWNAKDCLRIDPEQSR